MARHPNVRVSECLRVIKINNSSASVAYLAAVSNGLVTPHCHTVSHLPEWSLVVEMVVAAMLSKINGLEKKKKKTKKKNKTKKWSTKKWEPSYFKIRSVADPRNSEVIVAK